MGVWGAGNFENDYALDVRIEIEKAITTPLERFVKDPDPQIETLDDLMASIEIHIALIRYCGTDSPEKRFTSKLRRKILRLYDNEIDTLKPDAIYKRQRRSVLVKTLDAYASAKSIRKIRRIFDMFD